MKTIWKFEVTDEPIVMPERAQILKVGYQFVTLCLWALVDPAKPKQQRRIVVLGTGFEREDAEMEGLTYIDTVFDGSFVWHVFDGGPV